MGIHPLKKYINSYENHEALCSERFQPTDEFDSIFSRVERLEATQYPPLIRKLREKIYRASLYLVDHKKYKAIRESENECRRFEESYFAEREKK